ncbi:hypothetical protein GCM10027345_45080 [Hymenobacter daeguensis]
MGFKYWVTRGEQVMFGMLVPGWDACRMEWDGRYEWRFGVNHLIGLGLFAPTLLFNNEWFWGQACLWCQGFEMGGMMMRTGFLYAKAPHLAPAVGWEGMRGWRQQRETAARAGFRT